MLTLGGVFLAIHIGRMPISGTLLGIISPFIATAGDLLMTLVFATLVVLPWRLLWRRFTRPAERLAWSLQGGVTAASAPAPTKVVFFECGLLSVVTRKKLSLGGGS